MPFPKELADRVESCRYAYLRIKEKALQKLDYILSIQAGYKDGLLESIEALKESVGEFETDYDEVWYLRLTITPTNVTPVVELIEWFILALGCYANQIQWR